MKKIFAWLLQSNHLRHLAGGYAIGVCSDSAYCGMYAGVIAASSLEFKDKSWGGEWDWIDWGLTVLGAALGSVTKLLIR